MNGVSARMVIWWATQAVACTLVLILGIRVMESSAALADNRENAVQCERLCDEIQQMRRMSSVADQDSVDAELDNSELIAIARRCKLEERQITAIDRVSPQRVGESDYERRDLVITLDRTTMQQAVRFALSMEQARSSARVTNLTAWPRQDLRETKSVKQDSDGPHEYWRVQLTLTQLIYIARSASR